MIPSGKYFVLLRETTGACVIYQVTRYQIYEVPGAGVTYSVEVCDSTVCVLLLSCVRLLLAVDGVLLLFPGNIFTF